MKRNTASIAVSAFLASLLLASTPCVSYASKLSDSPSTPLSSAPYTFGDLAAAKLSAYDFLDDAYLTPQAKTSQPLSRLDAVKLLYDIFGEETNDARTPFTDVPDDYAAPVGWAYQRHIVSGVSAHRFGVHDVTEQEFTTMLLRAIGYGGHFAFENAVVFIDTVGLRPIGVSDDIFTLGDAAQYIVEALEGETEMPKRITGVNFNETKQQVFWTASEQTNSNTNFGISKIASGGTGSAKSRQRTQSGSGLRGIGVSGTSQGSSSYADGKAASSSSSDSVPFSYVNANRSNVPEDVKQIPFPKVVEISPDSVEEADAMLQAAISFVPRRIEVDSSQLTEDEFLKLFRKYRKYTYGIETKTYPENVWYESAMDSLSSLRPVIKEPDPSPLTKQEANHLKETLAQYKKAYEAGYLDGFEYGLYTDMANAEAFGKDGKLVFRATYNDAWLLVCDLDPVFTAYKNDSISEAADAFYEENVAEYEGRYAHTIVSAAEQAICAYAEYDSPISTDGDTKTFSSDAHSPEGFFEDGHIVCDGYSSVFQYCMLRAGIPCVEVLGSTKSEADALDGRFDHSWSKVCIDGKWYNVDVCWANTCRSWAYSLKSDRTYANLGRWGACHATGAFEALTDFSITAK